MSEAEHIYQAIGEILATLVVAQDGAIFLDTGSSQYRARVPRKFQEKYHDSYQDKLLYWRVYPTVVDQGLAFEIVKFTEKPFLGDGQFKLQGDWIESGQLQIWRNSVALKVNAHNWRSRLLPVSWSDAPAPDQAFWQLKAQLVDGALKVVEAAGPFPHPERLEQMPNFKQKQPPQTQQLKSAQAPPQDQQQPAKNTSTIDWESIKPVSGFLELTIKINTLPQVSQANGRCHFKVDCDGKIFQISVKPKMWTKLETANTSFDQWVAALAGKLGAATADGFVLDEANIQVFERHSKTGDSSKPAPATGVETSAPEPEQAAGSSSAKVEVKTQTAPTVPVNAAAQSVVKPSEKSGTVDPLARATDSITEAKPKKIGKFKVEVR